MKPAGSARLVVLASGSSANATLLDLGGATYLFDCGLRPGDLQLRLGAAGVRLDSVRGVFLTHTHSDHWNRYTLEALRALHVPLYAHARHHEALSQYDCHGPLRKAGLAREYAEGVPLQLGAAATLTPVAVPHDADPTFGFRVDGLDARTQSRFALGYVSDCGHPSAALLAALAGVNVLAVEFNHDVKLQTDSGRHPSLISRVLGPRGHLSNAQAATFAQTVVQSCGGAFSALVQLHLSRQCNTPEIAAAAGRAMLGRHAPGAELVTALQHRPTGDVWLAPSAEAPELPAAPAVSSRVRQLSLPF